ncbi:hypothetical protein ACFQX6_00320 [Streptosporangium lutulentum]
MSSMEVKPWTGLLAGATRVEADDVEPLAHLRGQEPVVRGQQGDARERRSAGHEEQRADPAGGVGGRVPDHRDVDQFATGLAVVERHLGGGHLKFLRALFGLPVQRSSHGSSP